MFCGNYILSNRSKWTFYFSKVFNLILQSAKNINLIVARDDAVFPGELRTGSGLVATYKGDFVPPENISEDEEEKYLNNLINSDRSATDKALTLMFHNMRQQIFWDGNKRSAILAANKLMIENGAGLIAVPEDKYPTFLRKISDYYLSNDMKEVKEWTYKNGIQGIELRNKKSEDTKIDPNLQKYLN